MECIRHFFPKRKCFVFDQPVNDKELLAHIDEVLESQLDPKVKEQSNTFCSYIFSHARTNILREGVKVTGKRESTFPKSYFFVAWYKSFTYMFFSSFML